jgi:hypothetical protein
MNLTLHGIMFAHTALLEGVVISAIASTFQYLLLSELEPIDINNPLEENATAHQTTNVGSLPSRRKQ